MKEYQDLPDVVIIDCQTKTFRSPEGQIASDGKTITLPSGEIKRLISKKEYGLAIEYFSSQEEGLLFEALTYSGGSFRPSSQSNQQSNILNLEKLNIWEKPENKG